MDNTEKKKKKVGRRPATTEKGRNDQIIASAIQLAEKKILDGTASSQIICHYLKLASEREKKEMLKLDEEINLMKTKRKAIESESEISKQYADVIKAMKKYTGTQNENTN